MDPALSGIEKERKKERAFSIKVRIH